MLPILHCYLCYLPPNPRSLSPLGHGEHHNDTLLGMFYVLSPIPGITEPSLTFVGGGGVGGKVNLQMDYCLQKLLPSLMTSVSYNGEFINISMGTSRPIRMDKEGVRLWQHLIFWEQLAFLEAKVKC